MGKYLQFYAEYVFLSKPMVNTFNIAFCKFEGQISKDQDFGN